MGESGTQSHSKHAYRAICVSLTGEDELPERAAAKQDSGKPHYRHAKEIP